MQQAAYLRTGLCCLTLLSLFDSRNRKLKDRIAGFKPRETYHFFKNVVILFVCWSLEQLCMAVLTRSRAFC